MVGTFIIINNNQSVYWVYILKQQESTKFLHTLQTFPETTTNKRTTVIFTILFAFQVKALLWKGLTNKQINVCFIKLHPNIVLETVLKSFISVENLKY